MDLDIDKDQDRLHRFARLDICCEHMFYLLLSGDIRIIYYGNSLNIKGIKLVTKNSYELELNYCPNCNMSIRTADHRGSV